MLIYKELGDEQSAADALKARDSTSGDICGYTAIPNLRQVSNEFQNAFRYEFGPCTATTRCGIAPSGFPEWQQTSWESILNVTYDGHFDSVPRASDVGAFIHCCHWLGNFLNFFRCWWFGFMMFHLESWWTGRKLRPLTRLVLVCSQSFLRIPRQSLLQCLSKRARIEDLGCLEQRKVTKSLIDPYIWIHRGTPSVKIGSDQRLKESLKCLMYVVCEHRMAISMIKHILTCQAMCSTYRVCTESTQVSNSGWPPETWCRIATTRLVIHWPFSTLSFVQDFCVLFPP